MSIKGFVINGQSVKYDYNALENKPKYVTDDLKLALLQLANKVAYIDNNGQSYYQDLYNALYSSAAVLQSITAVYTQSGTVYSNDSIDSLKNDLVVTAYYDDSTTTIVASTNYTLSGTLTVGTSTITVNYGGKTDTFNVTVTAAPLYQLANGTHNFTGTAGGYVTISDHSHIKAQRNSGGATNYNFVNLSDLNGNGTEINNNTNINNKSAIFTLQTNDSVRFVVSNVTGDFDDYTIGLRKANGSTSVAAVSGQTTDVDNAVTVESGDSVGCLFLYFGTQNGTNKDITCDIAVYVNGTQYF